MGNSFKAIVQVILILSVSVFLCLFVPASMLIEFFFVLLGVMIITGGGLVIMREVITQIDLRHHYKIQHEIRELELRKIKRQQILFNNRCKHIVRRRVARY